MEKTVNTKKTVKETVFNSKGRRKNLLNCIIAILIAVIFLLNQMQNRSERLSLIIRIILPLTRGFRTLPMQSF